MTLESLFIARLALAAIFLISVVGKIADPQSFIASLAAGAMPLAPVAGWVGILIELIAPLALIIGWQARWAAVALAIFTAAASVIGHPFWNYAGEAAAMQQTQFLKNLAIIGGLMAIALHGDTGTLRQLLAKKSHKEHAASYGIKAMLAERIL